METKYGHKYNASLSITEIAKLIRNEIKAAIKAGELPDLTASVTVHKYSGGRTLNVKITKFAGPVVNVERAYIDAKDKLAFHLDGPSEEFNGRYERPSYHSTEIRKAVEKIDDMVRAYNFDGSDSSVDYFFVNFYRSVGISHELTYAAQDAQLAALELAGWIAEHAA